jgi:integrase
MLRRYIRPAIDTRILASLSPLEIQSAYQIMIDRKLSARTVRYAHAVLRAAIRQAIRWHLLLSDPTQGVQLPSPQCREMSVLTTEQARSFLRAAVHSTKGWLFAVALTTGMRPSEYLALCWQDIDWDRGTVSVVRSIHRHDGQWIFADTKRVRSRRLVKLQTWVLELLRRMKDKTQAPGEACDTAFADLIFTTAHGDPIKRRVPGKEALQATPAGSWSAEHSTVRSPSHIRNACPHGRSSAQGGIRAARPRQCCLHA